MNIKELKRTAKANLKGKWGVAIGAFLIVGAISSILSGTGSTTSGILGDVTYTISFSFALGFLVTMPLQAGLSWFFLDIYDGKNVDIKQIFDGFKYYGKVLGASVLISILTFLWALLLVVPGIIKGISYSQTLYIIRENPDVGIKEAIQESQRMMNGYKWTYFLTDLSFIGWYLAPVVGIIAAVIFLILGWAVVLPIILLVASALYLIGFTFYFVPYYSTTFAGFYRELTKKSME